MRKMSCSRGSTISKSALLGYMGYPPFAPKTHARATLTDMKRDRIMDVLKSNGGDFNRASVVLGISAASLRRQLENSNPARSVEDQSLSPTRAFFEKITSPWSVTSLDYDSGEVCMRIDNPSSSVHLSYTLPIRRGSS